MLILGDGEYALDYLRRDSKNIDHGLNFSNNCTAKNASNGLSLIENSFVEVISHGHFTNWYSTLPTNEHVPAYITHHFTGGFRNNRENVGSFELCKLDDLIGRKRSVVELIKYFPDLNRDIFRYGIQVPNSKSTHKIDHFQSGEIQHAWSIHGASTPENFWQILNSFAIRPNFSEALTCHSHEEDTSGIVTLKFQKSDNPLFKWPSTRETLNHDTISYADEFDTLEIVDCYLVAYQLSMLSRYFPDLWIGCLESQCKAAKLIEQAVLILTKKFPILALSILSPAGLVISTHREPWRPL
jgi:hypothetical protein